MTVPYSERRMGKFKVLLDAADLAAYFIKITANEKYFPKRYRWNITSDLVGYAKDIYNNVVLANSINAKNSEEDAKRRLSYQRAALEKLRVLVAQVDLAYLVFHLPTDRIDFIAASCYNLEKMIKAWIDSDLKVK